MSEDQQTYQRAIVASLAGLAVQGVVALALVLLSLWSRNAAVMTAAWHAFGGLALWACLWVVFQQHRLERIESLEAEQLAQRHGTDSSIFETSADDLSIARRRLGWLYKWVVPIVSLATSAYLIGIGIWLVTRYSASTEAAAVLADRASPLALGFISGAITFFAFLVSRYVAGMAKLPQWRLLRGGSAYLMGTAVAGLALTVAFFAITGFGSRGILQYLAVIIPVFMILVGSEIALNFVLNFYRPRRPGEQPRPAFDSRLLNLLTTPESFAKTISEAINYQFGFEITRSWFWQLLSRVFGYLVVFAVIVMLAMSCIVIVEPNQKALVTRFGQLTDRMLGPGPHLKLPWPISNAEYYNVTGVRVMRIGSHTGPQEGVPILWSNEHTSAQQSPPLIVAPPNIDLGDDEELPQGGEAPSVSLLNAEIVLQYRVDPDELINYVRSSADAGDEDGRNTRLRVIAEQQITRYLLRHSVDEWIGTGRVSAGENLRQVIQEAADRADLGVQVLNVIVAGIHPPLAVADAFHGVVGSEQAKQTAIEEARRQAIRQLAEVAGSTDLADRIVAEIEQAERMRESNNTPLEKTRQQEQRIESLLLEAGGLAAQAIAEARGYRWTVENTERGKAERFAEQLLAFQNAPKLYRMRRLLEVLQENLPQARKFLLATEYGDLTIRGDFTDTGDAFGSFLQEVEESGP